MKRKQRNGERNTNHIMIRKKKKKKVVKEDPLVDMEKFDPDMQLDIISRLPFKEAVRCRCVCKSWYTLLDDSFLINNIHAKNLLKHNYEYHHHAHNYSCSSSSTRLSFISTPRTSTNNDSTNNDSTDDDNSDYDHDLSDFDFDYDNDDSTYYYNDDYDVDEAIFGVYDDDEYDMCSYKEMSRSSFTYPPTNFRKATTISSCNGLICFSIKLPSRKTSSHFVNPSSIIIYNPITKEKLKLRTYENHSLQYKILTCGFGYHPFTKQYKILRCSYNHEFRRHWFEIHTLGTTVKWRQIQTTPDEDPNFNYHVPGVHVNGALYWISTNNKKRMIISLDLGDDDEKFRIITSLPPPHSNMINIKQGSSSSSLHYKLKESQGCLYLIVDHHSYIEIWLMMRKKERKKMPEYSWTKVMKISTDYHKNGEYEFAGLTKSGKVLFWHNRVLTCFDPKTERFESLSSSSGAYRYTFVPHVNSLVSLKALQSTDIGEEKYLCKPKVCTTWEKKKKYIRSSFTLNAYATTGEKKEYSVQEIYKKFV